MGVINKISIITPETKAYVRLICFGKASDQYIKIKRRIGGFVAANMSGKGIKLRIIPIIKKTIVTI
tara:strand:+ start:776 stop:973 length:198 start_codon:yes stop_codon:yes gene_type:complete